MSSTPAVTQTNPLIRATRPMFTKDGRKIDVPTDVKNDMPKEWLMSVREGLKEKIGVNYNEGRGEKGNYYDANTDLAFMDLSTTSRGPQGSGVFEHFRPDADGVFLSSYAAPGKLNLYC